MAITETIISKPDVVADHSQNAFAVHTPTRTLLRY